MAKIYPEFALSQKMRAPSEEKFRRAVCESFSDEWTAFFNLEFTNDDACRCVSGEIDFALFHEIYGIAIVEIKGGKISFSPSGEILQNGHKFEKDPWAQSNHQKNCLIDFLDKKFGIKNPPFAIAAIPCFPDSTRAEAQTPPVFRARAIWGEDLADGLEDFVVNFLKNSRSREEALQTKGVDFGIVRCAIQNLFEIAEKLRDHSREESETLYRLTMEQACALNADAGGLRRFRVSGSCGTGKTLIATEKARRLASEGKSVLLLCYNILLASHLKRSVKKTENVVAGAFSEIACNFLGIDHDLPSRFPKEEKKKFFDELPNKFYEHLRASPKKFDAVIVDEAQDFSAEMWRGVEELVSADGYFVIFYDWQQNLFKRMVEFPPMLANVPNFSLSMNCRNTKKIFRKVNDFLPCKAEVWENSPEGERVEEFFPKTREESREMLEKILHDLRTRSVPGSEITIIGARSDFRETPIGENTQLDRFELVSLGAKRIFKKDVVNYFTIERFKGCETGTLILIDVKPGAGFYGSWDQGKLYTAASRAKNRLYIIYAATQAKKTK